MQSLKYAAAVAAALWCMGGCGDDASTPSASGEQLTSRWSKAGLETSAFEAIDGAKLGGGTCTRGKVNGIETTVCQYASESDAAAAQPRGLGMVGRATGASLAEGRLLLVVADRKKVDPSGRVINKMTRVFRGRKAPK